MTSQHLQFCLCFDVIVYLNVCWPVQERKEESNERPTAAKTTAPDIIEDDISDYSKDRNLSLFVVHFLLDYCFGFSGFLSMTVCKTRLSFLVLKKWYQKTDMR